MEANTQELGQKQRITNCEAESVRLQKEGSPNVKPEQTEATKVKLNDLEQDSFESDSESQSDSDSESENEKE